MQVIPAIDIKDGKCVRLLQGSFTAMTTYADDPVEMALYFEEKGASKLHIVDLDGAQTGCPVNRSVVQELVNAITIPVQLGGGIRSLQQIESWLNTGVTHIIVSTLAWQSPESVVQALKQFGPDKIFLAVDMQDGKVSVQGWQEDTGLDPLKFLQPFKEAGLKRVIYTEISRDGTLRGPDIAGLCSFAKKIRVKITASGGISSLHDLELLAKLSPPGVDSVIVGRAFYEGTLQPEEVFNAG